MYYLVTPLNENRNGLQFSDGLVIDDQFGSKNGPSLGRITFTTKEHIEDLYDGGAWIRPVTLPTDNPDFVIEKEYEPHLYWANMVICDQRFSLTDFKYLTENGFAIPSINLASENGMIDVLNYWKESGLELKYTYHSMDSASEQRRIDVLEWWKNSGLEIKYSDRCLDIPSKYGYIDVLEWWKNSGLEIKYSDYPMDIASTDGRVNVLEWWKNSGIELKYSHYSIDNAYANGHNDVLEWWKNSSIELKYSHCTC